jgi:hypothetical protein
MHLIDKKQGELLVLLLTCLTIKLQEIADCIGISP